MKKQAITITHKCGHTIRYWAQYSAEETIAKMSVEPCQYCPKSRGAQNFGASQIFSAATKRKAKALESAILNGN